MIDGLWEKANQVNEIGYKIDSLAGIAELVAERISENVESGACWTLADLLKEYGDKLETLASDIMLLNKEHEAVIAKLELKKGKKK
jgi:DNA polymerase/3'-5' exonuclease PolX